MAERSNATSKKNQDAAQDVGTLQKRGRRRLVGAIALVLLAVIVLPMVFDPEPRPNTPTVSIRIPSEEGTKFTPKAQPKPTAMPEAPKSAAQAEAPKAEEKAAAPTPALAPEPPKAVADAPVVKPVEKKVAAAPAKPTEKKTTPVAPPASGEQFMVQVGAFASPDKVKEITDQLKDAKLAHYTETVATAKGSVTRVRLGPFASKEAAEKARERAKALGLNPANPVAVNPVSK